MILETKLYLPPLRPEMVPRPELLARLSEGLHRRLTLVSAPAGYGKTALIGMWLRELARAAESRPVALITLDEGDNVPARFFAYLVAALRRIDDELGAQVWPFLESPQLLPAETLLTALVNGIAATPTPFILVLDDYHTITEPAIHEAVDWLIERQPSQMHLVIGTRHDPPLALSRLRGRDQMTEIRQSDLCFTPAESSDFLTGVMDLALDPAAIEALLARTEGWVTGLQLAALSLRGCDPADVDRFIAGFSGRHHLVLDYLTDEVIERQPEPIQHFLLQTSILDRICAPLCDAVLEPASGPVSRADSQAMLDQLDHANLFLMSLDNERRWFRYHTLFAQLLQARLREIAPGLGPELHRRAARWFEENELASEAIEHALASEDSELAADVIERSIRQLSTWARIDIATFSRWLPRLPERVVLTRPWLRLFKSRFLYLDGQLDAAYDVLAALEQSVKAMASAGELRPGDEELEATVRGDRLSYATMRGEISYAIETAKEMMAELASRGRFATVRPAINLATAYLQAGNVRQAGRICATAIADAKAAGLPFVAPTVICGLALVQIAEGRLHDAYASCREAMEELDVRGAAAAVVGRLQILMGEILYEWNHLQAAEEKAAQGLKLIGRGWSPEGLVASYALMARIKQAIGEPQEGLSHVRRAVEIAEQSGITRLSLMASAHQARLWLAQGSLEEASLWAQAYEQVGETEYLREFEDLVLAHVRLAEQKPAEVLALLDKLLAPAEAAGRGNHVIEILVLQALAQHQLRRQDAALEALSRALRLAKEENHVRVFIDADEPMAQLLRMVIQQGTTVQYPVALLRAFGDQADADSEVAAASLTPARSSVLPEPLTDRELEVLELLAKGLSNRELARRLHISLPTVKSHTSHIYQKLAVHSRREAVARARALDLL